MKKRKDLSDWLFHFVHERKGVFEYRLSSYNDDEEKEADEFTTIAERECEDQDVGLGEIADSFTVLKSVLRLGYLRAGFSYRKERKTVYGHRPTVCFTEMPLYALIDYAKGRGDYSSTYAIAFPRNELFSIGARNVIYGLSTPFIEAGPNDKFYKDFFRSLAETCGIGLEEQYRYVTTNLSTTSRIDWTHEREWRLPCNFCYGKVGLNFLIDDDDDDCLVYFSSILVIVNTNAECDELLNDFAQFASNDIYKYSSTALGTIKVVSLEHLNQMGHSQKEISLDDLTDRDFKRLGKTTVTKDHIENVYQFIKVATDYAQEEYTIQYPNWNLRKDGIDYLDECAFVNVKALEPRKPYTKALLHEGIASANGADGILLFEITEPAPCSQSKTLKEFYYGKVAEKLQELTGEQFSIHVKLD